MLIALVIFIIVTGSIVGGYYAAINLPGFLAARKLPLWGSLLPVVALELLPLLVIRDNLTLNILNLIAPSAAIAAWQAG